MNCLFYEPVEESSFDFCLKNIEKKEARNCGICRNWDKNKYKCKLEHLLIGCKKRLC